jgi:hypothetical protein
MSSVGLTLPQASRSVEATSFHVKEYLFHVQMGSQTPVMARLGGGPETYRALNWPPEDTKHEVLKTLSSIRETHAKVD